MSKKKVTLIVEYMSHLTGGRYYAWLFAYALKAAGADVTVYTNQKPGFLGYLEKYKKPKIIIVPGNAQSLVDLDVGKADIYIGCPLHGIGCAIKNSVKYGGKAFPMVFDPLPMQLKYLKKRKFPGWAEPTELLKNPEVNVLTLCRATHQHIYSWLNKEDSHLFPVYPCINSLAKKAVPKSDRGHYAVFVSRIVDHKKFDHVVWACRQNHLKLKVVSSASGKDYLRVIKRYRMESLTEFYFNAPEDQKFELIKGATVVINGAIFEGFGMWMAEAIECGTPVVCYDYPTFREMADYSGAKNIYFARWGNHKSLSQKLQECLTQRKFEEEKECFSFASMVKRVSEVFDV